MERHVPEARAGGGDAAYYDKDTSIPEDMARRIPKDVDMVYWDYTHMEPEDYEKLIANHRPLAQPRVCRSRLDL